MEFVYYLIPEKMKYGKAPFPGSDRFARIVQLNKQFMRLESKTIPGIIFDVDELEKVSVKGSAKIVNAVVSEGENPVHKRYAKVHSVFTEVADGDTYIDYAKAAPLSSIAVMNFYRRVDGETAVTGIEVPEGYAIEMVEVSFSTPTIEDRSGHRLFRSTEQFENRMMLADQYTPSDEFLAAPD